MTLHTCMLLFKQQLASLRLAEQVCMYKQKHFAYAPVCMYDLPAPALYKILVNYKNSAKDLGTTYMYLSCDT